MALKSIDISYIELFGLLPETLKPKPKKHNFCLRSRSQHLRILTLLNSCRPGGFVVYGFTAKIVATVSNGFRVLTILMVFTVFLDLGALGFRLGIYLLVASREFGKMGTRAA